MLAGYTHMTISIAAIIGEAVGSTALIIPLGTAILISRTITKVLAGDTVDEFQIHKKGLWFLESEVPESLRSCRCTDLMQSAPTLQTQMSPIRIAAVLKQTDRDHMLALPVVGDTGRLQGLVSRKLLVHSLRNRNGMERRKRRFKDVVERLQHSFCRSISTGFDFAALR